MKIYHCMNPEENPIPVWMRQINCKDFRPDPQGAEGSDPVQGFQQNPNAFPQFMKIGR